MKIELHKIPIRDVVKDFYDNPNRGCSGYGGRLNIRPSFQREFVYNDNQRNEVIRTVMKNFPLNVMYWIRNDEGNFEMLDGQQRTISVCEYVTNIFSVDELSFGSLSKTEQNSILDYELMIYICAGDDKEKLDWFKIINIAGEKLTTQEARNAIYSCAWLADAKNYFSKPNCAAKIQYGNYLSGKAIRQEYLETALKWIADRDNLSSVEDYMDACKKNNTPNAKELWNYIEEVFAWVRKIFPTYNAKLMKGLDWGIFYNKYSAQEYDTAKFEKKIRRLILDDDVTNKRGIYLYLLSGEERHLNVRAFSEQMKQSAYERQRGICAACKKHFELNEMEGDHIKPWSVGGKTSADNCQMLCRDCNRRKSNH
ncbi:MAG: HNH endonuclease [Selenomonadaceae bacterium]|nr:HNH endonuclease [Selenomonadaceae bacterium]